MKRGTSLQSRRGKAGGTGDPPQKGSPQIHRRSTQEALLLQVGRPRSSSTTDTPSSPAITDSLMLLTSGYHSTEEQDRVSLQQDSSLEQLEAEYKRYTDKINVNSDTSALFCVKSIG